MKCQPNITPKVISEKEETLGEYIFSRFANDLSLRRDHRDSQTQYLSPTSEGLLPEVQALDVHESFYMHIVLS